MFDGSCPGCEARVESCLCKIKCRFLRNCLCVGDSKVDQETNFFLNRSEICYNRFVYWISAPLGGMNFYRKTSNKSVFPRFYVVCKLRIGALVVRYTYTNCEQGQVGHVTDFFSEFYDFCALEVGRVFMSPVRVEGLIC